jgi:hypothetical protein
MAQEAPARAKIPTKSPQPARGGAACRSGAQWSRKHAHTQRRLCERFAAPVIGTVTGATLRPHGAAHRIADASCQRVPR